MTQVPGHIRLLAEEPDRYLPDPAPPSRRLLDDRFVLFFGATRHLNLVSSVRAAAGAVEEIVEETRAHAALEQRRVAWVVGPSCRPGDLTGRLAGLGFFPADTPPFEPAVTAMALTTDPAVGEVHGVVVRAVGTRADYLLSDEITGAGFGVSDEERDAFAATGDERFEAYCGRDDYIRFLALLDGAPVATAAANACGAGLVLGGAATLPEARGRGAYRALVRARWDEAVRRRTPALVIQAGSMSRPILERTGFQVVCELSVLQDPATMG